MLILPKELTFSSQHPCEVGTVTVPISQMRELKQRNPSKSHSRCLSLEPLPPWGLTDSRPLWCPCVRAWPPTAPGSPTFHFYSEDNLALTTWHSQSTRVAGGRAGNSRTGEIVRVGKGQEPPGLGVGLPQNSLIDFPSPWSQPYLSPHPYHTPGLAIATSEKDKKSTFAEG